MVWRATSPPPIPRNEFAPRRAGTVELCQRSIIRLTEKKHREHSTVSCLLCYYSALRSERREAEEVAIWPDLIKEKIFLRGPRTNCTAV